MQRHIEADLVKPLAAHDQDMSRFSRMRMPPRERRVRMPQTAASHDQSGRAFLPFAIDGKFTGGDWRENDVVGCVYTENGGMFVKLGDSYRPASVLLGASVDPVAGVCQAAPAPRA
jgi:hypothetical protein